MSTNANVKIITALVAPMQDVEDTAQSLYLNRRISTSVGEQLDQIGVIVGQSRGGMTDDDYRRYIRARVATNSSDGLIENILTVADLVVFDDDATYTLINYGAAGLHLRVDGIVMTYALATVLIDFLRKAVSGGVRIVLEFFTLADAATFCFEDGAGLGFGDTMDAATGGGLASAIE